MKKLLALLLMRLLLCATGAVAGAPPAANLHQIGYLDEGSFRSADIDALQKALHELGYIDGQTIAFETRFAGGRLDHIDQLANELVQQNLELIVARGLSAGQAARRQTRTIPIVMVSRTEPVRVSGNVTGATNLSSDLSAKRLQLLKEISPRISRVAILWYVTNPIGPSYLRNLKKTAGSLGVEIAPHKLKRLGDFGPAFETMATEHDNGIVVEPQRLFTNHLPEIVGLCLKTRLPTISGVEEFTQAGGLISYGLSVPQMWRHTAILVDHIFKRAKPKAGQPAELPAEQPTKFELAINLKTAKQIGIVIPSELLNRADRVIK